MNVRRKYLRHRESRAKTQPHRSFRLTGRRDYKRSLELPSYATFTLEVSKTIWSHRRLFASLAVFCAAIVVLLGGMSTQDHYVQLQEMIADTTASVSQGDQGVGELANAGILMLSAVSGGGGLSDVQQIYLALSLVLVWLTTVWLLRELLAGRRPKLRDGLYNSGSPLVSTILTTVIMLLQLLPIALAIAVYAGLSSTGLASDGFGAMLAILGVALTAALTLYWLTSTLIALVVVTLPGMYPMRAIRAANDLVVSRRLRVMYRFLWMVLVVMIAWLVVMVPLILLEVWLRDQFSWLGVVPTIPILLTLMSSFTVIWAASYVYLFYRKLVGDDSTPG